jgi:hypothetical protein
MVSKTFADKGCPAAFVEGSDAAPGVAMAEKPALHLEELNLKYEGGKPAKHAFRARIAGGWLVFIEKPGRGGLGGVTFYPDPDHTWDGGTQEGHES